MAVLRIGGAVGRARGGVPLLAAPANVPAPAVTQPPVVDPNTLSDLDFAKLWVAPLTIGFNPERWSPIYLSWRGNPLKTSTAYWEYLKGLGVSHIRLFFPYRPGVDMMGRGWTGTTLPPVPDILEMIDTAETIIRGGLKVHIDATDVVSTSEFQDYRSTIESHVDRFAGQIALRGRTRLPPTMLAVGAYNELELDPGPNVEDIRLASHRILRARLPGYVLATGAALWNSYLGYQDASWQAPPDKRCFAHWHDYAAPDANFIQARRAQYEALSDKFGGIPIISGECAAGPIQFEQSWLTLMDLHATYYPLGRANYWALNEGKWYSWSVSASDLTLRSDVEDAVRSAVAKIKASPAWIAQQAPGTSTGGGTTDPGTGTGGGTSTAAVRGRPIISGNTVKSDIGTFLRGGTMALDGPGSTASNYATNISSWQLFRSLNFNIVRVPFSLSVEGLTLAQQLPDMDAVVACASSTGLYCMFMLDQPYGNANYAELRDAWPIVCARYKDKTNVFFEMGNEPHWTAGEFDGAQLDSIAQVYNAMHQAAPNSLIGVFTPASIEPNGGGIVGAAQGLVSRGVTFGPAFVAFHAYSDGPGTTGAYTRSSLVALHNAFPCMLTETTSGGPNNNTGTDNEVFKIGEMEAVGVSWMVLAVRFGEIQNRDTPFSNDQTTLTQRVLPGVHAAGITWTQDPLGTTTGGGAVGTPAIVSITGNMASAVVGQPVQLTVTATGMATVDWVVVMASFAWRSDPTTVALDANGQATISFTPVAGGDFVKFMNSDRSVYQDSAAVPVPAGGGTGGSTGGGSTGPIPPNANSYFEGFDNNNSGSFSHIWGNQAALSFSNGIMRVQQVPGTEYNPDVGACGVMTRVPDNPNGGFGYGYYEIRARFFGSGPGPAVGLWAADNRWPPGEEDMGEIDNRWYSAHHYGTNNDRRMDLFYYADTFGRDLPRGQWITSGCLIRPGYLEYFVDGRSIGSTTNFIEPMGFEGGTNRIFFIMHRGGLSDTAVECDWVRFTPA